MRENTPSSIFAAAHPEMKDGTRPALLFHAKRLLIRARGNDAPAIACKARGTPRNHAPLAISQAAFNAVTSTLPLGSVGYENATNERGERLIWLDRAVVDRLRSLRGPGESYSDVILPRTAPTRRVPRLCN
jgi:hypothetical protein